MILKKRLYGFYLQRLLLCIGILSGIGMSLKLWLPNHSFPTFPVIHSLTSVGNGFSTFLLVVFIGLLVLFPFFTKTKALLTVLLTILLVLLLQDQQRWQPWIYQYALMLLAYLVVDKKTVNDDAAKNIHRLILAGIYLWSGLHKLHPSFISVFQNSMLAPITSNMTSSCWTNILNNTAYLVPVIEVFIGIGLLFSKTKRAAVILAVVTHAFILLLLSPLVKNHFSNTVIWPWNITMSVMVVHLFWKEGFVWNTLFPSRKSYIVYPIVFLVLLAPSLFYLKAWDRYLSFNLYSGKQKRVVIYFEKQHLSELPEAWKPYLAKHKKGDRYVKLPVTGWAVRELNVPFVSETRNIRSLMHYVCDQSHAKPLFYIDYKHIKENGNLMLSCEEMEKINGF